MTPEEKPKLTLIQRIVRYLRPESGEFQDAVEDNIHFDRDKVDEELAELIHAARKVNKASTAFVAAAELLVKDVRYSGRSKSDGKKGVARHKSAE